MNDYVKSLMQALIDGKTIQIKNYDSNVWVDCSERTTIDVLSDVIRKNVCYDIRIKPTIVKKYANVYKNARGFLHLGRTYDDLKECQENASIQYLKFVKMIEVEHEED